MSDTFTNSKNQVFKKKLTYHDKVDPNFLYTNSSACIKKVEFGFGVFAIDNIYKDEIIEECHYIKFKTSECTSLTLNNYVFGVADDESQTEEENRDNGFSKENAIVLGLGSIFNHSYNNNTDYYLDTVKNVYVFYAIKDIKTNEQICISYGENWWKSREITPNLL